MAISPDGGRIATASADGTIVIWNAETAEKVTSFEVMTDGVQRPRGTQLTPLTFSPDGTRLAIGGYTRLAKGPAERPYGGTVWDAATGK